MRLNKPDHASAAPRPDGATAPRDRLDAMLHYGYLPDCDVFLGDPLWQDFEREMRTRQPASDRIDVLVRDGAWLWLRLVRRLLDHGVGPPYVVPLSGGLDSRAILCALLRHVDTKDVVTTTLGVPGALDFEIGRQVAATCGVAHEAIDLRGVSFPLDALIEHAAELGRPVRLFESYLFHQIRRRFGANVSYWTGFLGDPLAGSHLRRPAPSRTWQEARQWFARHNAATRRITLSAPAYQATESLPPEPLFCSARPTLDEQLDLAIRQYALLRPIILLPGYHHVLPFAEREWAFFLLSMPAPLRCNQRFYKSMLTSAFPREFALPTKNTSGLPLAAGHVRQRLRRSVLRGGSIATTLLRSRSRVRNPHQNYIDFGRALAADGELAHSCALLVDGFAERGLLGRLDPRRMLHHTAFGVNGFAPEICLIASAECFIRAGILEAAGPPRGRMDRTSAA